jgi:putative endonuclease
VLGANVWAAGNELDLIVRRGRELRFVEVKEKRSLDPFEAVTAEKQRRVRRAASAWLASRPELAGLSVGFDVVGVRAGKLVRLRDAF